MSVYYGLNKPKGKKHLNAVEASEKQAAEARQIRLWGKYKISQDLLDELTNINKDKDKKNLRKIESLKLMRGFARDRIKKVKKQIDEAGNNKVLIGRLEGELKRQEDNIKKYTKSLNRLGVN